MAVLIGLAFNEDDELNHLEPVLINHGIK